ncbi:hypothetical protein GCM10027048_06830 [Hymenobacter coalescens]
MRCLLLLPPLLAALLPARAAAPDTLGRASAPAAAPVGLTAQPWYRPHHVIVQTAAGQGMVAAGVGYTTLRGRVDVDVLGGYVPSRYSITPMGIFTAKAGYSPWTIDLGPQRHWQVRPFTVGALVSHTASRGMNNSRDGKYEKGYYWWSSRTRIGGFVGGKVSRVIGTTRHGHPRTLGAYYELGTNDLYLSSIFTNLGGLGVHEILTLGFGVKLDL